MTALAVPLAVRNFLAPRALASHVDQERSETFCIINVT